MFALKISTNCKLKIVIQLLFTGLFKYLKFFYRYGFQFFIYVPNKYSNYLQNTIWNMQFNTHVTNEKYMVCTNYCDNAFY